MWHRLTQRLTRPEAQPDRDDAVRAEIDRVCRGITSRALPGPSAVALHPQFGAPSSVAISHDPVELESLTGDVANREIVCPVCDATTEDGPRIRASLELEFSKGLSFLVPVWVHPACLERCAETGKQRGIPW
jgi:hypothetical protein